jgi:hypothetical protein
VGLGVYQGFLRSGIDWPGWWAVISNQLSVISNQFSERAKFPLGGRGFCRAAWDRVVCVVNTRSNVICGCAHEFALSKKNRRQTGELGGDSLEFAELLSKGNSSIDCILPVVVVSVE